MKLLNIWDSFIKFYHTDESLSVKTKRTSNEVLEANDTDRIDSLMVARMKLVGSDWKVESS